MYNLNVNKIYKKEDTMYFFLENKKIYIEKINDDQLKAISEIVLASNEMSNKGGYSRVILKNINGQYFFDCKSGKYILTYGGYAENINILLEDVVPIEVKKSNYNSLEIDILKKWEDIIDKIEIALTEYNKECKELMKYVNYYIGLGENAIQLYKSKILENRLEKKGFGLCHYSINYDIDIYASPLNLKIIECGSSIGNYVKNKLYKNELKYDIFDEIKKIIKLEEEKYALLATIMFQDNFFEEIEKIIWSGNDEEGDKIIKKYINKVPALETILKYVEEEILEENIINWLEEKK